LARQKPIDFYFTLFKRNAPFSEEFICDNKSIRQKGGGFNRSLRFDGSPFNVFAKKAHFPNERLKTLLNLWAMI